MRRNKFETVHKKMFFFLRTRKRMGSNLLRLANKRIKGITIIISYHYVMQMKYYSGINLQQGN